MMNDEIIQKYSISGSAALEKNSEFVLASI